MLLRHIPKRIKKHGLVQVMLVKEISKKHGQGIGLNYTMQHITKHMKDMLSLQKIIIKHLKVRLQDTSRLTSTRHTPEVILQLI